MSIIYFILILSVIIIIHELGHLISAKHFHVYCQEFSIGMGPVLFKRQCGETAFAIRALPLGGFVAMAGEDGVDSQEIPVERTIKGITWWKQIVVMAAGAIMNVILAWILFIAITMIQGRVVLPSEPIIQGFTEASAAQEAGFEINDRIIRMTTGKEVTEVNSFDDISEHLAYFPEAETVYTIQRGSETLEIALTPRWNEAENRYLAGFQSEPNIKEITVWESFRYGSEQMLDGSTAIFRSLSKLIRGIGLDNLSGPVGIYQITAETTQNGLLPALSLIALLSLNIGIFNLLPLPILDGGRIVLVLIEKIAGRPLSEKAETVIMTIGVVLLVMLMLFATWQDIMRLFV